MQTAVPLENRGRFLEKLRPKSQKIAVLFLTACMRRKQRILWFSAGQMQLLMIFDNSVAILQSIATDSWPCSPRQWLIDLSKDAQKPPEPPHLCQNDDKTCRNHENCGIFRKIAVSAENRKNCGFSRGRNFAIFHWDSSMNVLWCGFYGLFKQLSVR